MQFLIFKHALVRLTGNHRMYVLKSVPMRNILSPASQTPAVPAQSVRLSRSTRSAQIPRAKIIAWNEESVRISLLFHKKHTHPFPEIHEKIKKRRPVNTGKTIGTQ